MLKAAQRIVDPTDVTSCVRHPMSVAEQVCHRCGHDFCTDCVVYPFGISKGAMCIACALEAGGVSRQRTGRPHLSRKQIRDRVDHGDELVEEPGTTADGEDERDRVDMDQAWLDGDVDPESLGGWSRTF